MQVSDEIFAALTPFLRPVVDYAEVRRVIEAALSAAPQPAPVPSEEDDLRAAREARELLFRGFMVLTSGGDGSPYVKVSFPELKMAQDFHRALIALRTERQRGKA